MRKRLAVSFLALTLAGCAAAPATVPIAQTAAVPAPPSKPVAKPTPKPVKPPDPNARFRSLIQMALKTPRPSHPTVPKLARLLTRQCRNDQEKALVLYTWIASHIHYDHYAAAHDEARPDQSGQATLRRGSAVCEGYSRLFVSLAQECGLNAVKLSGYVKSWDKVVVDDDDRHAWNAAYWDNRWHLLDCTWGAGDIKSGTYPPEYFDVPPEQMLASHFPDDPAWQLRLRAPCVDGAYAATWVTRCSKPEEGPCQKILRSLRNLRIWRCNLDSSLSSGCRRCQLPSPQDFANLA